MGQVHAREAAASGLSSESGAPSSLGLDSVSAQVTKVHVDGVGRTREDLIQATVEPVFKAQHFEDLVLKAQEVRAGLQGEDRESGMWESKRR